MSARNGKIRPYRIWVAAFFAVSIGLWSVAYLTRDSRDSTDRRIAAAEAAPFNAVGAEVSENERGVLEDLTRTQADVDISRPRKLRFLTEEMGKFYLAIGVMDAWHCFEQRDPTICRAYYENLKDPVTHLGFALFMKTANHVSSGISEFSGGAFSASYLGLAAGAMAQNLFSSILHHPLAQEIRKTAAIQDVRERWLKRHALLRQLWQATVTSQDWWYSQVPSVTSLILSSVTAGAVQTAVFSASETIAGFRNVPSSVATIAAGLRGYNAASRGLKLIWEASGPARVRVHPLVMVGGKVVELIFFLGINSMIEEPIETWWSETDALSKLVSEVEGFERGLKLYETFLTGTEQSRAQFMVEPDSRPWAPELAKHVAGVQAAWDEYRSSFYGRVNATMARHREVLANFDHQLTRIRKYDQWIASGMDFASPEWEKNEFQWHEPKFIGKPYDEAAKMLDSFFCGPDPSRAIEDLRAFHGLVLPWASQPRIEPFRVVESQPDFCPDENAANLTKWARDLHDLMFTNRADPRKVQWIRQNRTDKELQAALEKASRLIEPIRKKQILNFERQIQTDILEALSGKKVEFGESVPIYSGEIRSYDRSGTKYGIGVIPSLDQEVRFWQEWVDQLGPDAITAVKNAYEDAKAKRDAAFSFQNYSSLPPSERKLPNDFHDPDQDPIWKQFVEY